MRDNHFVGEPIEDLDLGLRLRTRLAADYPRSRVELIPYLFSAEQDKEIEAALFKMLDNINNGGPDQPKLF